MGYIKRKMTLVGVHDGQTVTLRAGGSTYEFKDGSLEIEGPTTDVESLGKYLQRCWQAYPDPSRELDEARAAIKGDTDASEADKDEPKAGDEHPGGTDDHAGPAGDPAPEPKGAAEGGADAQADPGAPEPGRPPEGDGQSPIVKALMALDPADDEAWTADGKPKMTAIEAVMGRSDITRAQVTAAAPDFDREAAAANR